MKFNLWYASGLRDKERVVHLETIDDVIALVNQEGYDLVFQHTADDEPSIIVYDSYLE